MNPKITKHMLLGDVAMQYPESGDIFFKYGLHCIGCHVAMFETIEQGALAHGLAAGDIDNLVKELNDAISKTEKKK